VNKDFKLPRGNKHHLTPFAASKILWLFRKLNTS
jgi:hypothetical protein